jgi:hypothetical protein
MRALASIGVLLCLCGGTANAAAIFASDGSQLYQIDGTTAGVLSSISLNIPGAGLARGLAFSPSNQLWGVFDFGGASQVGTIDLGTGNVSLLSQSIADHARGLAFDQAGNLFTFLPGLRSIQGVDMGTGAVTSSFASTCANAFSFAQDGTAWVSPDGTGIASLPMGAATGTGSSCGSSTGSGSGFPTGSGSGTPTGSGGAGTPPGLFVALYSFGSTFYGIQQPGGGGAPSLVSFDGTTLQSPPTTTAIGILPEGVSSLAVQQDVQVTPEPAAVALMGMGFSAMAGMVLYRRRRR